MSEAAPEPVPAPAPPAPSKFRKVLHAVRAAFTSPDAVKQEKNFAVFVAVRLALSVGASAGLVAAVAQAFGYTV